MWRRCWSTASARTHAIIARRLTSAFGWSASCARIGTASAVAQRFGRRSKPSFISSTEPREAHLPDLHFQVVEALATPNAAVPQLSFKVRITNSEPEPVHSVALCVQVQIEPVRRRYSPEEQARLKELFGEPERWSKSVHPLLWTNTNVNVTTFTVETIIEVPVPCTFDFNVAVTKYIYGLDGGELPISLMFSG